MPFAGTTFIYLFLPIALLFYHVLLRKNRTLQNVFLLFASLVFYAWGHSKFVLVLLLSVLVNWGFGYAVDHCRNKRALGRALLVLDVIFNVGLLFVFKHLTVVATTVNNVGLFGWTVPQIVLPIGISCFTLSAMSYVVDVYRQKEESPNDMLSVGLYIAFFPKVIAGPIVRYNMFANEMHNRQATANDVFDGFSRFLVGLSKKVLLANHFALLTDRVFDMVAKGDSPSVMFSWLGAVGYAFQIFFDFSGYSDMAIGLGKMFGFTFSKNFDNPYLSTSVSEFWRRWNISLGAWFRDYVYALLGGDRVKPLRRILNLLVVGLLIGLLHGANGTFVLWGVLSFVWIAFEKWAGLEKKAAPVQTIFKWLYTMLLVVLGWVLFRSGSVAEAFRYIGAMFGLNGNAFVDGLALGYGAQNAPVLLIGVLLCTPIFRWLESKIGNHWTVGIVKAVGLIVLFVLSVSSIVSGSDRPFIYFCF